MGRVLSRDVATGAQAESFKVGIVAFVSGPAAESQGLPTWQAAQMTAKELNAGALPKPYDAPGLGGIPLELQLIDESGSTTKQIQELRNGYERRLHSAGERKAMLDLWNEGLKAKATLATSRVFETLFEGAPGSPLEPRQLGQQAAFATNPYTPDGKNIGRDEINQLVVSALTDARSPGKVAASESRSPSPA